MAADNERSFVYKYSRKNDLNFEIKDCSANDTKFELGKFDRFLRDSWTTAMANGCFRYNLDDLQTKIIPGEYKYVAQLNVQRFSNRRPPEFINSVKQDFNEDKFNFTKIPSEEILFELQPLEDQDDYKSKHQVVINVSPIEMGHVLLVPFVEDCLPQILTVDSLVLAIDMVLLSRHRGFRIGWNSLCAFASVNHLHFHALYLDYEILVDHTAVSQICKNVYESTDLKCRGFAFQLADHSSVEELARLICQVSMYFTENEIAHNLVITRGKHLRNQTDSTLRVFLWPKKPVYGISEDCFNSAACEVGGHLSIKEKEAYKSLTEEKVNEILGHYSFSSTDFNQLKINITKIIT